MSKSRGITNLFLSAGVALGFLGLAWEVSGRGIEASRLEEGGGVHFYVKRIGFELRGDVSFYGRCNSVDTSAIDGKSHLMRRALGITASHDLATGQSDLEVDQHRIGGSCEGE